MKEIVLNETNKKSMYYVGLSGKSACYLAIEKRKFNIYAFLTIRDINFKNENEYKCIDKLEKNEKIDLRDILSTWYPPIISKQHILQIQHYTTKLKCKSHNQTPNTKMMINYILELYEIHNFEKVLAVIECNKNLEITFDSENENKKIELSTSEPIKGRFMESSVNFEYFI